MFCFQTLGRPSLCHDCILVLVSGENIQELIVGVLEAFGRALKVGHILKNFARKPLDLNS